MKADYINGVRPLRSLCGIGRLSDQDARILFKVFTCFSVERTSDNKYKWEHFGTPTSTYSHDVLMIVDNTRLNPLVGCIIADRRYIDTMGVYTEKLIQSLAVVIETAKNRAHAKHGRVCSELKDLTLSPTALNAILRAIVDKTNANDLIRKASKVEAKQCRRIPHPLTILSVLLPSYSGRKEMYVQFKDGSSWMLFADVCDIMEVLPQLISKRQVNLYNGYCVIDDALFMENLPQLYYRRMMQFTKPGPITRWTTSMLQEPHMDADYEFFGEWLYVHKINNACIQKRADSREALMHGTQPPQCIAHHMEKGKQSPWDNRDRYQYAYVLRSVAKALGTNVRDLSDTVVDLMREYSMGEERIREFTRVINSPNGNYTDKVPCKTRVPRLNKGITCPFGAGTQGVKRCIASRKQKGVGTLSADTATISDIWTRSEAILHAGAIH